MQDETVGWVKSIHESRYGELLGLVMLGPHVTDLIEAGVIGDVRIMGGAVPDLVLAHSAGGEGWDLGASYRRAPKKPV